MLTVHNIIRRKIGPQVVRMSKQTMQVCCAGTLLLLFSCCSCFVATAVAVVALLQFCSFAWTKKIEQKKTQVNWSSVVNYTGLCAKKKTGKLVIACETVVAVCA